MAIPVEIDLNPASEPADFAEQLAIRLGTRSQEGLLADALGEYRRQLRIVAAVHPGGYAVGGALDHLDEAVMEIMNDAYAAGARFGACAEGLRQTLLPAPLVGADEDDD